MRGEAEVDEVVEVGIDLQDDVPAFAPVSAIGASHGDEFFPAEATAAIAPFSGTGPDADAIDKHDKS